MNSKFSVYVLDCETSGLSYLKHSIIELSLQRFNTGEQKTWCIKPHKTTDIEQDALRVNGHKLEDILHKTDYGRQTYLPPEDVIVDIENWIMTDGCPGDERVLVAQNTAFDLNFLFELWNHCKSIETFPFGNRPLILDTRQLALFLDICEDKKSRYYNLGSLVEKYGVKKLKSHRAENDVIQTVGVLEAQFNFVRKLLHQK